MIVMIIFLFFCLYCLSNVFLQVTKQNLRVRWEVKHKKHNLPFLLLCKCCLHWFNITVKVCFNSISLFVLNILDKQFLTLNKSIFWSKTVIFFFYLKMLKKMTWALSTKYRTQWVLYIAYISTTDAKNWVAIRYALTKRCKR